jgi:hypothetical protein
MDSFFCSIVVMNGLIGFLPGMEIRKYFWPPIKKTGGG